MSQQRTSLARPNPRFLSFAVEIIPGALLCVAVAAAAEGLRDLEARLLGRSWLEALVIAILLGTIVRACWTPGPRWRLGIDFGAKTLLEIAVVLLGATVSAGTILGAGPALLAGVVLVVCVGIAASYGLGRLFGLPRRMAILIACGNSICGNSAIVAVAPVIGADGEDVAASIAFTAVLGVAVVIGLPALAIAWQMTPRAFGVFAGLTVYAVPQVLAATAPISSLSAQIGTLVKLVRVLMLGPVVLALSLLSRHGQAAGRREGSARPPSRRLAPWFIIGFLLLVAAKSAGLLPEALVDPVSRIASGLTLASMAALGLGVDARTVARAGFRVSAVVTLSLLALGGAALLTIRALGLG
jgi:uncharacterized integral membrane protein (TIGR00698 family)